MDEGKKCLESYTNPRYFLDEWIAEQLKQRAAAKVHSKMSFIFCNTFLGRTS
jgi:hypothetical protein